MLRLIFLTLLTLPPVITWSQQDSLPTPTHAQAIALCRQELLHSLWNDNRPDAQFWLDSLRSMEDDNYLALQWDERWLFYFWLENYAPLLDEVAHFTKNTEAETFTKYSPPNDSLFEWLDAQLYRDREQLFRQIDNAWLSGEERDFAALLLHYLLRLSNEPTAADEFDARLNAFLAENPTTRFAPFMRAFMFNTKPPASWAVGLDALFLQGNWSGDLERNFKTAYGADFAVYYWQNRWNLAVRMGVTGQKLLRPVEANTYEWPKDDPSVFFDLELEAGYDLFNKPRLRIFPTVGGGYSTIRPPEGDDQDPNPDYYSNFKFNGVHLTTALQADVKFRQGKGNVATSYHGIRVRMGYHWLNLKRQNPALQGNMFFFAVGYTIFSRQAQN